MSPPGDNSPNSQVQPAITAPTRTLLPGPVASLITTITQTASFGLRVGTKVGGFAIVGARETTLTGLELTRVAVEAILTRAGRDVSARRTDDLGRAEAEGILQNTISSLHHTIASASFFASTGFQLSTAVLTSASALSVQGLSTLNAVLGDTESSRAVAAIIELIKEEMKRPGSGREKRFVGYIELFSGTVGFVLLQRWGRRQSEREFRQGGGEEVIWDTVIDDKGFRADVVGTKRTTYFQNCPPAKDSQARRGRPISFISPAGDEAIDAIERGTICESPGVILPVAEQARLSDDEIRDHITKQLPDGCHAVISSETITAKTIRVDLYNANMADVTPPPGTIMVREHFHHAEKPRVGVDQTVPSQTIVFRTALRRTNSTEFEKSLAPLPQNSTNHSHPETRSDSDDDAVMMKIDKVVRGSSGPTTLMLESGAASDTDENSHLLPQLDSMRSPSSPLANQKKSRQPMPSKPSLEPHKHPRERDVVGLKLNKTAPSGRDGKRRKDGPLRKALKSLSPSSSFARFDTDLAPSSVESRELQTDENRPSRGFSPEGEDSRPALPLPVSQSAEQRTLSSLQKKGLPPLPGHRSAPAMHPDTVIRQSESYTSQTIESRPGSPTITRSHSRTMSGLSKTTSDRDRTSWVSGGGLTEVVAEKSHRRSRSHISSLYSMASKGSETSLILASKQPLPKPSIFDDYQVLSTLATAGKVPGIFPNDHLVRNVRRYVRFSSASYGSQFLRFMGLSPADLEASAAKSLETTDIHHEHSSFSQHTGLPPDTILLSSFEDPHGVVGFSQSPSSALPLVHFVSIDRESKAVVLTCRGTLGFEDVLTDMLCDFDELSWRGASYKVHKGIHASARRMLYGNDGRVMATLKAALEEYPDFGLVLTGHSLGGAVASLLAILISEPSALEESGASFTTTTTQSMLMSPSSSSSRLPIVLPAGRPIHVYAYGPPATVCPSLRIATRGLITTIVNANDIVPTLSLGILHDFRAVALKLKNDNTGQIAALFGRIWARVRYVFHFPFHVDHPGVPPVDSVAGDGIGEDNWAWNSLKGLRGEMDNEKLVPPGEVFVVETTRVFDRQDGVAAGLKPAGPPAADDSATERVFRSLGRPATRVQMKLIRDVEGRFGELRFGSRMFSDHSPARYEATLAALGVGILED